ncbi:MAG: HAAS signaling domain-containing protein [Saccharofermentanales bacterium]
MNRNFKNANDSLTDRYVYAVTKRLPAKQRSDIEMEIRSLIDDMLHDLYPGKEAEPESVDAVLSELGNPSVLADQYRGKKTFLIGPEYFDVYFIVLKIVLAAVMGGIVIAMVLKNIVAPPANFLMSAADLVSTVMSAAFQGFAWVTIIFALIERYADPSVKKDLPDTKSPSRSWKPEDLPHVPEQNALIRKSEPIVGIIFGVLFLVLLNTAPQIFGVIFTMNESARIIPFFNLDRFDSFLPLLNVIICLGLLKESFRLFEGKHTLRLSTASLILGACSLVMTISVIINPDFWNQQFVKDFSDFMNITGFGDADPDKIISNIFKGVIILSVVGFVVETITNFYKSIRYR